MKKKIYLVSALLSVFTLSAQSKNRVIQDFELQNQKTNREFNAYWAKRKSLAKTPAELKAIEKAEETKRAHLDFMFNGRPVYLKKTDLDQVKTANVDYIQNGQISGLSGSFNGENIEIYEFDGGRIYANHTDFNGSETTPSSQIVNLEGTSVSYSDHATNVAGMMIGKGTDLSGTVGGVTIKGNTKGVAPKAKIYGYSFSTTTLPGNSSTSTVYQKIQTSQPTLSNHSYGTNTGWDYEEADGINYPKSGWYYNSLYDPDTSEYWDLQGAYHSSDSNYDSLVRNNPAMVIVKSAGNSFGMGPEGNTYPKYYYDDNDDAVEIPSTSTPPPNNCANGYDCIGTGSLGKNVIIVASNEKITIGEPRYTAAGDITKADYSSAGPRDDGGIKPDITSVGSDVFSASYDSTSNAADWSWGSGTSYSAPNVTGVIALWNQINKTLFADALLDASKAKTLLIHSASETGSHPGPDAWFGWGLVNAKKGAELLVAKSNGSVYFEEPTLTSGTPFTKKIQSASSGPLKVTISWVDMPYTTLAKTYGEAHNNRKSVLVNDLDLRIVDTTDNTVYLPWKLDLNNLAGGAVKGDNTVDNVEQVLIDNAVAGRTYRIEVSNKGTLQGGTTQDFAIIAEGEGGLTLATNETNKTENVSVFPTITKDFVNIQLKNAKLNKISVFDMSGKLLANYSGEQSFKLDASGYSKGVYIIAIETSNGEKITKKFIKE